MRRLQVLLFLLLLGCQGRAFWDVPPSRPSLQPGARFGRSGPVPPGWRPLRLPSVESNPAAEAAVPPSAPVPPLIRARAWTFERLLERLPEEGGALPPASAFLGLLAPPHSAVEALARSWSACLGLRAWIRTLEGEERLLQSWLRARPEAEVAVSAVLQVRERRLREALDEGRRALAEAHEALALETAALAALAGLASEDLGGLPALPCPPGDEEPAAARIPASLRPLWEQAGLALERLPVLEPAPEPPADTLPLWLAERRLALARERERLRACALRLLGRLLAASAFAGEGSGRRG